ncbi:unnamed protein product [Ixodes persulcatus]
MKWKRIRSGLVERGPHDYDRGTTDPGVDENDVALCAPGFDSRSGRGTTTATGTTTTRSSKPDRAHPGRATRDLKRETEHNRRDVVAVVPCTFGPVSGEDARTRARQIGGPTRRGFS